MIFNEWLELIEKGEFQEACLHGLTCIALKNIYSEQSVFYHQMIDYFKHNEIKNKYLNKLRTIALEYSNYENQLLHNLSLVEKNIAERLSKDFSEDSVCKIGKKPMADKIEIKRWWNEGGNKNV